MDGSQVLPEVAAEQPRDGASEAGESNGLTAADIKLWIHEILDLIVKILPVAATLMVAFYADSYKASLTTSTLLSEREKADSQLRSEMFSKLVDPISGAKTEGILPLEREQLLAEMLSLNFHEHIGLKPLLSHVDARIAREHEQKYGKEAQALDRARQSFRSIAKTVISRQTAMLTRSSGGGRNSDGAQVEKFDIGTPSSNTVFTEVLKADKVKPRTFGNPFRVKNPAGTHYLNLNILDADWQNETFRVEVGISPVDGDNQTELTNREFELSWFDFPLTDNTLLADGTRFALVLDKVYDAAKRFQIDLPEQSAPTASRRVQISVVWFPKDFIAARERPTNYQEFRRSLGLDKH